MQAIFESLAKQQEENTKEIKSLSKTVEVFYKDYISAKKKEETDRKRKENAAKRKSADQSFVDSLTDSSKSKTEEGKKSVAKGGGFLGGVVQGALTLGIGAYLASPAFRNLINKTLLNSAKNLFPKLPGGGGTATTPAGKPPGGGRTGSRTTR